MAAITSQNQHCSQLPMRAWPMIALIAIALGCAPSAEERVRGVWVGDTETTLSDPLFAKLTGRQRATAEGVTAAMISGVRVELGETECTYTAMGRRDAWPCQVIREEPREVVVYHVELPQGRRVLRAQPTPKGLEVSWWDGRKLALRRP